MKKIVFDIEKVIDDPREADVWVIYTNEEGIENYHCLHSLLYKI